MPQLNSKLPLNESFPCCFSVVNWLFVFLKRIYGQFNQQTNVESLLFSVCVSRSKLNCKQGTYCDSVSDSQ